MHLSEYMTTHDLSDEDVAAGVARNRATVSRWRRRLMRPDWAAIEALKSYTEGAVTADDWTGPLLIAEAEAAEARA